MITTISHTSLSPIEQSHDLENLREHEHTDNAQITNDSCKGQQDDMLSVTLFPSSLPNNYVGTSDKNNISSAVTQKDCDHLLEEESPTPILQQDVPLCCSTPDKMECGSLEAKHMSRSPSIPLQNTSIKMSAKVDATPVVLPQRMMALEGLYPDDSSDCDSHNNLDLDDHNSLELFDDPLIPSSQSKDDHNITVDSPMLFTADQQTSILPQHLDVSSIMNTMPSLSSPALGDSISTQVSRYGLCDVVCVCVCVCACTHYKALSH